MQRHQLLAWRLILLSLNGTLAACAGGGGDAAPEALNQAISLQEDSNASGTLRGSDADGDALAFVLDSPPMHGQVTLDGATGNFLYTPAADFFGSDQFSFSTTDRKKRSAPARVSITVENVNDAPVLAIIPPLSNSAYTNDTRYALGVRDVDGDPLKYSVTVDNPALATAEVDATSSTLIIHPIRRGVAHISVRVQDAEFASEQSFEFTIGDVTKSLSLPVQNTAVQAIRLFNSMDAPVQLSLTHNGFTALLTDSEMADTVAAMAPVFDGEPFARKLWRFLRNNVYHNVPLDPTAKWVNEPSTVINSLGWGFCSQVASSYVRIARAAGYEARVHGLTGHVVPEIKIDGRWRVYDPDLAVYYRSRDNELAGVQELESDSTLISEPTDPLLDPASYPQPYSQYVADIYSSAADNFDADSIFIPDAPAQPHAFELPAGAAFVYPGHWTPAPIGYDGAVQYQVPFYLEAAMAVPAGWGGSILSPWLVWDIQGDGRVRLGSAEFEIGAEDLTSELRAGAGTSGNVDIIEARTDVTIIFLINALGYVLKPVNTVEMRGIDVWAVSTDVVDLPAINQVGMFNVDSLRKPTPTNPR